MVPPRGLAGMEWEWQGMGLNSLEWSEEEMNVDKFSWIMTHQRCSGGWNSPDPFPFPINWKQQLSVESPVSRCFLENSLVPCLRFLVGMTELMADWVPRRRRNREGRQLVRLIICIVSERPGVWKEWLWGKVVPRLACQIPSSVLLPAFCLWGVPAVFLSILSFLLDRLPPKTDEIWETETELPQNTKWAECWIF